MNCAPTGFDAGAAWITASFMVMFLVAILCQLARTLLEDCQFAWLARIAPEWMLIRWGLWCECSGDPFNAWAEEFDRRDAILSKGQK